MIEFSFHRSHQIGVGSSGVVYAGQARFGLTGAVRPVAIKVMHESKVRSADAVESFAREAVLGYELAGHPNLILTRAYGRTPDGCPYLVMDLEGPTLSSIRGQLVGDAEVVRSVVAAVGAALRHLADHGARHGDINFGNIFVSWNGVIKLGDYGRVRPGDALEAPEAPARDDRRALALVVYELIAGRSPFRPDEPDIQPVPADAPMDLRCVIHGLLEPAELGMSIGKAVQLLHGLALPQADRRDLADMAASWRALHKDLFSPGDPSDRVILNGARIIQLSDPPDGQAATPTPAPRPARRRAMSWPAVVAAFLAGSAATAAVMLSERAPEIQPVERIEDPRRDEPTIVETDVSPAIDESPGPDESSEAGESEPDRRAEPVGPRKRRGPARTEPPQTRPGDADRSKFLLERDQINNEGIKVATGWAAWIDAYTATLEVTVDNRSGARYHVAIVQLLDDDDQNIAIRVTNKQPWTDQSSPAQWKLPVSELALFSLRIADAHKLAGQTLTLVVSEPGGARRVMVKNIIWPRSPGVRGEAR